MFRNIARIAPLILALIPALTLAACGPSREEELERQLAEAKASAQQEADARQQAERETAAARRQANAAELAKFYSGDTAEPQADAPQDTPDQSAPPAAGPPPAGYQADGRPVGDEMPAPQ